MIVMSEFNSSTPVHAIDVNAPTTEETERSNGSVIPSSINSFGSVDNPLHPSQELSPSSNSSIDQINNISNNSNCSAINCDSGEIRTQRGCCSCWRRRYCGLCGDSAEDTAEYRARKKYLTKLASYDLVESAAPVFVAAGLNYSATNIILLVSKDGLQLEVSILMVYAVVAFLVGKLLTFHMLRDEALPSRNPLFNLIRRYNLSVFTRHCLTEFSGFAVKEFFVSLIFRVDYNFGTVTAVYGYVQMILSMFLYIIISAAAQRSLLRLTATMHQELLNYSAEAFAFSAAFNLTVLIAVGSQRTGWGFFSKSSYLFVWRDDYHNSRDGDVTLPYYILYSLLVHFLVGAVMYFEKQFFVRSATAEWAPHAAATEAIAATTTTATTSNTATISANSTDNSASFPDTVSRGSEDLEKGVDSFSFRNSEERKEVDRESEAIDSVTEVTATAATVTTPVAATIAFASSSSNNNSSDNSCCMQHSGGFRQWVTYYWRTYLFPADVQITLLLLWDTSLGYFAATSLFIIIADTLNLNRIVHRVDLFSYFFTLILVLLISLKFPSYIASAQIKQEKLQKHIVDRKVVHQQTLEAISIAAASASSKKSMRSDSNSLHSNSSHSSSGNKSIFGAFRSNTLQSLGSSSALPAVAEEDDNSNGFSVAGGSRSTLKQPFIADARGEESSARMTAASSHTSSNSMLEAQIDSAAAAAAATAAIAEDETNSDTSSDCCSELALRKFFYSVVDFYREMRWERRGVRMVSVRLSSGWIWEVIVQVSIGMIFAGSLNHNNSSSGGNSGSGNEAARLAEMCVTAACIVAVALFTHLYVRRWKREILQMEQQQQEQQEQQHQHQ